VLLCDGQLTTDFSAYLAANPGALGAPSKPANEAFVQAWFRDPPSPKTTRLSVALHTHVLRP
jgi:hypothetical protein